jgi:carbonic anhydrase/acetyltransferase-like protein (isoleucine patch superfamily)
MTTVMENSMIAQNTCLQMCVVGRNTFIGAGSTFTDFNLLPAPRFPSRPFGGSEDVLSGTVPSAMNNRLRTGADKLR